VPPRSPTLHDHQIFTNVLCWLERGICTCCHADGKQTERRPLSIPQAFAGTDPTSLHFARSSAAAQRAFWQHYVAPHILDSEPRLNFLAKGGEGAIVANLLPAQEVHRNGPPP
jgi:hypothetical protein